MKSFNQHISESMPCIHNGNCSCKIPKIVQDQCRTRLEGLLVVVTEADSSKYIVEKNPHDGKWYVMGHVGQNKWMPVSSGFKNKAKAQKWAKSQSKVDVAARGEVGGV